jgi:hypothetical protein
VRDFDPDDDRLGSFTSLRALTVPVRFAPESRHTLALQYGVQ